MHGKIAVGFDGSEGSQRALDRAMHMAGLENSALEVVSIEELPRYPGTVGEVIEEQETASSRMQALHEEVRRKAREAGVTVHSVILVGHPAKSLVDYVKEANVETLVIGHSGHSSLWGSFLGTTADKVVRHAPCSVLVVR